MHVLSAWFIRNPVAANLLMFLILVSGCVSLYFIRIEGFPAIPADSVSISTAHTGAMAEQVDIHISRRIERALEGMPGIKKISSSSMEGFSTVLVQKKSGFDMGRFQNEIKTRVDALHTLPKDAERPVVTRDEFTLEALLVQVHGTADKPTLQQSARRIKDALLADPAIARITSFGLIPYEIRLEVDESDLNRLGLALSDLAAVVKNNALDYKKGILKSESGRIVIYADARPYSRRGLEDIPVKALPDGSTIRLGDVAAIVDGFDESDVIARFQGTESVGMLVYTSPKGDLMEVSRAAHKIIEQLRPGLPQTVVLDIWAESSIYMKARLDLLKSNAFQGLAIVFIMLALFLNTRLAFWVAVGIPVSISGTLAVMGSRFLDYSLNDITTFGLIIVLGILVDDAVVVGESVFEQKQSAADPAAGTIAGVHRVSTASTFGCFTTVAAFYPSMLIDNELGKIFASFSMVVIVCLLFSLLESKLILPAHLAGIRVSRGPFSNPLSRGWSRVQKMAAAGLDTAIHRFYHPILQLALRHRYSCLILFITLAVTFIGMMIRGQIRTVFFPEVPGQIIMVDMEMNSGAPVNLALANMSRIEAAAELVNRQAEKEVDMEQPPIAKLLSALVSDTRVKLYAELQPEKIRQMETLETVRRWRENVGTLEGVRKLSFSGSAETAGGFEIEVRTDHTDLLHDATRELMTAIQQIKGIEGVTNDLNQGSPRVRLKLKSEARHLGLTASDLAVHIGNAFGGVEVQRFLRHSDEVNIMLKYGNRHRRYMGDLMASSIRTPSGTWVPLTMVAAVETDRSPSGIHRKNGLRVATIQADLDKRVLSPEDLYNIIRQEIEPGLAARYPGFTIQGAGDLAAIGNMKGGLKKAMIIVLVAIFVLIAVPLKSYFQPFIIMSVIPFALVGAAAGHQLMGFPLSILSFLGMLGASGVVVNDSIVMLTRFNDLIRQGTAFKKALVLAGKSRFRAIFLTTATTVLGLTPMMFESSEQAQYLIPAAISLAFGELFATPVTLVLIPVLLHITKDVTQLNKVLPLNPALK